MQSTYKGLKTTINKVRNFELDNLHACERRPSNSCAYLVKTPWKEPKRHNSEHFYGTYLFTIRTEKTDMTSRLHNTCNPKSHLTLCLQVFNVSKYPFVRFPQSGWGTRVLSRGGGYYPLCPHLWLPSSYPYSLSFCLIDPLMA